ncbi:hypothetical protein [Peribacillus muralis]|uniref:hypothetical protein n=1 Tax=Peribacillus muralis TaxID=264697 RepID=UPI003D03F28A
MFKNIITTSLLVTTILGSASLANAATQEISPELPRSSAKTLVNSISKNDVQVIAPYSSSVTYVGGRLEGTGSKNDNTKTSKFTLKNSTGTSYVGWQRSEKSGAVAHLQYDLVNATNGQTVSSLSYYGDVSSDDNNWLKLVFNNVVTTKDYYLVVKNLGGYPVNFAGNVYN